MYFVWTEIIPLPPSPQLLDWIVSIVFAFALIVLIIGVICSIITFDFWCRPVFLTENEITRGFIFRKRIRKEDITGIGIARFTAQRRRRRYIIITNVECMFVPANATKP